MPIVNVVCGIIVNEQKEILVCQRGEGRSLAGKWEFPGGKIETDESAESALKRELHEELGVEISIVNSLTSVLWNYGQTEIMLHPFICRINGGVLRATEHQAIAWCTLADLQNYDWADADLPIVDEIQQLFSGDLHFSP
jgi:8-oxo-dGTP diphosphatase